MKHDRKKNNKNNDVSCCYLEQQQAGSQTGHQQQVVFGPPDDFLQAADSEDVLTVRTLLQPLLPITTHGVQYCLQDKHMNLCLRSNPFSPAHLLFTVLPPKTKLHFLCVYIYYTKGIYKIIGRFPKKNNCQVTSLVSKNIVQISQT